RTLSRRRPGQSTQESQRSRLRAERRPACRSDCFSSIVDRRTAVARFAILQPVDIRVGGALTRHGGRMTLSARNHLQGTIEEITWSEVLVHVTVRVGENVIESVITRRSAEEMALKK